VLAGRRAIVFDCLGFVITDMAAGFGYTLQDQRASVRSITINSKAIRPVVHASRGRPSRMLGD